MVRGIENAIPKLWRKSSPGVWRSSWWSHLTSASNPRLIKLLTIEGHSSSLKLEKWKVGSVNKEDKQIVNEEKQEELLSFVN